ncbi:MAG: family 16 glycosylhydrolase [Anaerolineae bacterium]
MSRLPSYWEVTEVGAGRVSYEDIGVRMAVHPNDGTRYSNAQVTDYGFKARAHTFNFRWQPPLRMTVRARTTASGDKLHGTAGFGFWNHPFSPDVQRFPRLPRAIWFFFASPPSNMALAQGVPGRGWKAAQIDAAGPGLLALAPLTPFAALAYRSRRLYDRWFPPLQRAMRIEERSLDLAIMADWHTYVIEWRRDGARFIVDDETVLETDSAPRGPVGFVAWMDTRWAVVTPQGHLGFGLTPVAETQALLMDEVEIEKI